MSLSTLSRFNLAVPLDSIGGTPRSVEPQLKNTAVFNSYLCFILLMEAWCVSVRRESNTDSNIVRFYLQSTVNIMNNINILV